MAKRLLCVVLVSTVWFAMAAAHGAPPVGVPQSGGGDEQFVDAPAGIASEVRARLRFAPMWMPIPKYAPAPDAEPVPAAAYAMIWQAAWQREIGLTAAQQKQLEEVRTKALAEAKQQFEHFESLTPEQQQAEVKSWGGRPSPSRRQLESEVAKSIEAVLTPAQLQRVSEYSFPQYVVGLLYDAKTRRQIAFGAEQEDQFRHIVHERLTRLQEVYLEHADKLWGLFNQRQQAQLPEVVKQQGPTSAALSIAHDLGFDMNALALPYPMLAQEPVRERLRLNREKEKQLTAVMADVSARSRRHEPQPEQQADDKQRIDAILTSQQLALLKELDLRRRVVLALTYPEKRAEIGTTEKQAADLERIEQGTHERLYRIDREMLAQAIRILSPAQLEQLSTEIDRLHQP